MLHAGQLRQTILTTEETTEDSLNIIGYGLVTHGGVAFVGSSDYKAPTNILIHAPAKISLDYFAF